MYETVPFYCQMPVYKHRNNILSGYAWSESIVIVGDSCPSTQKWKQIILIQTSSKDENKFFTEIQYITI